ncbi:hypothetical protein MYX07_01525 [Patescibacteria group bacterium AH-259-L07]|nr:hypothetical protein [Patescibacteria group bacterium AH-259-L07]
MNTQVKKCQNCKGDFQIEPDDFDFYKKVKVPPPTFCPECRLQRRLLFRNERVFYSRTCDLCDKSIVSMYPEKAPFPVYCSPCWWSDKWDPLVYGREYNFSRNFFEQYKDLLKVVPMSNVSVSYKTLVNSEYNNYAHNLKNCYLLFNSDYDENCIYGTELERSKDCIDITMADALQLSYQCVNCNNSYQMYFSIDCEDCQNIWFSKNLINCNDCFGCVNLRNKQYYIFNKPYSQDDYFKKLQEFDLNSFINIEKFQKKVREFYLAFPHKFMHGRHNTNVSGDYISYSKNVYDSYIALESQDCRYCMWLIIKPNKNCYDYTQFGENAQLMYEDLVCGKGTSNVKFSLFCVGNVRDVCYSKRCYNNCSNLFACISLKSKEYCILNKQYSRQEYEVLVPKIIQHMNDMHYTDKKGRVYKYGEFFPSELSPFAYNETSIQEFFPLTKQQAREQGYTWKDPEKRDYEITIQPGDLPDRINDVNDDILNSVIGCSHEGKCIEQCTTAFKIIPDEFQFYKKMNLSLPRLCSNCRHHQRLQQRNPLKLWHRQCQCAGEKSDNGVYQNTVKHSHGADHCSNEFETSYAPERPEIIYCEKCYQQEVV